ncbi:DUF6087 family protein [Streptomyces sp. IBSNAI002]|uniref:DUF6087 family protein n=1 Tax=Streptomyces sp. IBSNAI002 TaxID=3457500 RepID=UPI003FCFD93A
MDATFPEPADEPLEVWAARRERGRRRTGELRAVPLAAGPARGSHVDPGSPRMITRWDGFQWQAVAVVPNYAAARQVIDPAAPAEQVQLPRYSPAPLRAGRGRHRRTCTPASRNGQKRKRSKLVAENGRESPRASADGGGFRTPLGKCGPSLSGRAARRVGPGRGHPPHTRILLSQT